MSDSVLADARNKAARALFHKMHNDYQVPTSNDSWQRSSITLNFLGGFLGTKREATKTEMVFALGDAIAKADLHQCALVIAVLGN